MFAIIHPFKDILDTALMAKDLNDIKMLPLTPF